MDFHGINLVGWLKRDVVDVAESVSYPIYITDSGKIFTNAIASAEVRFVLPTIETDDSDYIGIWYTFVKTAAYQLTIDAAAGDYIASSTVGGQLYNASGETQAVVTIVSISNTLWLVLSYNGTWVTV